jgi:phosphoglycerate dehydrogenase-like enzyme
VERKIVLLLNNHFSQQIFAQKDLARLEKLGEVVKNQDLSGPSSQRVGELICGADAVVTSWNCPALDKKLLNLAPDLKVVAHAAGSVKYVVTDELFERGIKVTTCSESLGIGVAETALALTIASLKNMWFLSQETRRGGWNHGKEEIRELYGITIGVVGAGKAGRHYIKLLQNFDVEILLADPTLSTQEAKELGTTLVELDELIERSDVISIHAPSIPETRHMFNSRNLPSMKDGAILINTARGALIDEDALVAELRTGRIFAAIDVTDPEPPLLDHPFRSLPNVVLLPHIAGAVNNGLMRMGAHVASELERFFTGQELTTEVEKEQLSSLA